MITPKTVKKIEGEGMKIFDKKDYMDKNVKRGDLYIQFEIEFPKALNES